MGNKQGKGARVAIIKDPEYVIYNEKDYRMFFQDPDHMICSLYDSFDQFIQKQSLKKLRHIIIIQQHKQHIHKQQKVSKQNKGLVRYMRQVENIFSGGRNVMEMCNLDKVVNYIKKYSLENINLYIYVKEFKNFIIPQSQVPYVTLVSTSAQLIMSHIINETAKNMGSAKFRGFVKDLYRRKLVVVISKYCGKNEKQFTGKQQQASKATRIKEIIKRMQQNFKLPQNNFQYQMVSSVQQLSEKLKSMYFQFMICIDNQDLLEIIQFRKKMPIQSKLIYYGSVYDLGEDEPKNQVDKLITQKKKKQIWRISDDFQGEISPVMKNWWNAKTQTFSKDKIAKNVIIFLNNCENIIQKEYIHEQILKRLTKNSIIKPQSSYQPRMTINIQYKIQQVYKRLRNDLYTIVIMFDATNEQFEMTKKIILSKIKGEPRVQLSLLQVKQDKGKDSTFEKLLQARLQECSNKRYYEFKQQISPIEKINCLNMTVEEHNYFSYKMGLEVNVIEPPQNDRYHSLPLQQRQRRLYRILQNYFPKFVSKNVVGSIKQKSQLQLQQHVYELWSTFENFYIVCSFDNYLRYLFPYLVLVNFYDKKRNVYEQPTKESLQKIMNYINRIKVIIYDEVEYKDDGERIGLKQLLRIHQNPAQAMVYIKKVVCEFIQLTGLLEKKEEKVSNDSKKQKRKQPQKLTIYQQQKQAQQQQQKSFNKLLQRISSIINKPLKNNTQPTSLQTRITFPNIQFVHFKLSEIQSHLNLSKYNKLSLSTFPKGSLKEFHQARKQVENVMDARTVVVKGSLGAGNEELERIFEKNVVAVASHRMEFIKPKNGNEINLFQTYIKKYSALWKLHYSVMHPNPINPSYMQFNPQSLQSIKQSIIRSFRRSKNYDLLKVSSTQFKTFYIQRINNCRNLLDLQIAAIYIYSLPHGMSDVVTAIFQSTVRSTLSLEIFSGFLFVLFLNFFSFHSRKLEKLQTVIYCSLEEIQRLYQYVDQDEIVFNKSMLHLMDNQNITENQKNHCIVIQYENLPYMKRSSLSTILKVEELSFYKESAEYLLAPFTKLKLKKKQILKGKYMLYFDILHDNESNLFLKSYFQLNEINDIALFEALDDYSYSKGKKRRNRGEQQGDGESGDEGEESEVEDQGVFMVKGNQNNIKTIDSNKAGVKNKLQKKVSINKPLKHKSTSQPTTTQQPLIKKFTSHYRHAQQLGLTQAKSSVQFSIRLNLCFMKMLSALHNRGLFTPQKYLAMLEYMSESQQHISRPSQSKPFELVKQVMEIKKLAIYRAMIYVKRHEFGKAINQLDGLLKELRVDGDGGWMMGKVWELRGEIVNVKMWRGQLIQQLQSEGQRHFKQSNQNHQKSKSNQKQHYNHLRTRKSRKWKVTIDYNKQMFIMSDNSKKPRVMKDKQQEVYDIYCTDLLLGGKQQNVNIENYIQGNSKILFQENLRQSEVKMKIQQKKKQFPFVNSRTQKLFQQMLLTGKNIITLFHVYTIFTDILIRFASFNDRTKQTTLRQKQQQSQRDDNYDEHLDKPIFFVVEKQPQIQQQQSQQDDNYYDSQDELPEELSRVPQCFVLEKFQYYVSQKLVQYEQQQVKHSIGQKGSREQCFLEWLQCELKQEDHHQLHNLRKQLIQQYEFAQRQANKTNNQRGTQSQSQSQTSWIDAELLQKPTKWSVFEFEGKMIVVDANRKWKQKLGDSGKKQGSNIFYRQQNQIIQNQKAKRQLQQQNNN